MSTTEAGYRRLYELIQLDNTIQDLLEDSEYTTDETGEEYIDSSKRALLKATRMIESRLASSGEKLNLADRSASVHALG
jgi:hypothetical protein